MFLSDHALHSTESKRISAVGTVMFIRLLCFSASGFSRVALLYHINDLAAGWEKFSPGALQTAVRSGFLSAASFRREKRGQCDMASSASTCIGTSVWRYLHRRCSCAHPNLAGISRRKKENLFILPAPTKRVVSIGIENLQMPHIFFMGFPHISREVPSIWEFPSSLLV